MKLEINCCYFGFRNNTSIKSDCNWLIFIHWRLEILRIKPRKKNLICWSKTSRFIDLNFIWRLLLIFLLDRNFLFEHVATFKPIKFGRINQSQMTNYSYTWFSWVSLFLNVHFHLRKYWVCLVFMSCLQVQVICFRRSFINISVNQQLIFQNTKNFQISTWKTLFQGISNLKGEIRNAKHWTLFNWLLEQAVKTR